MTHSGDNAGAAAGTEIGPALRAVIDRVTEAIAERGWAVVAVAAEGEHPPFAYTVGLETGFDHPEIMLVGNFAPRIVQGVLGAAGERVKAGARFEPGARTSEVVPHLEVAFDAVRPDAASEHLQVADLVQGGRLERLARAVQLFLPDAAGRFPWDRGCDARMARSQTGLGLGPPRRPRGGAIRRA
ncbi:MAG: DUF4262 domain-containing protein [Acetobacteraceae bacterium]|nr:DUF4262 domain-containing protein [Acetobacteraceae bacterium]